jgi:hypothetical protein
MIATSFASALLSSAAAPDRADKLALYGWLVGSWTMDAVIHRDDGSRFEGKGEIHAAYVLEGRALQDVWVLPGVFYGTTLRIYDPGIEAWHILWNDPLRQISTEQIGRADEAGISQEGTSSNGVRLRWRFRDITANSFTWTGEKAGPEGRWQLQSQFWPRRT